MNINFLEAFNDNGIAVLVFLAICAAMNVGFYMIGEQLGEDRVESEREDNDLVLGEKYSVAEGFGTMIAMNIVLLFLSGLTGFSMWVSERARLNKDPGALGFCSRTKNFLLNVLIWMFHPERRVMYHRIFASAVAIGGVGHIAGNFIAYEDSGP